MKISFLSYFIDNHIPVYGGYEDQIIITKKSSIDNGDTANSLNIFLNNHIGTHIDFPFHFSNNGKNYHGHPDTICNLIIIGSALT